MALFSVILSAVYAQVHEAAEVAVGVLKADDMRVVKSVIGIAHGAVADIDLRYAQTVLQLIGGHLAEGIADAAFYEKVCNLVKP